MKRTIITLLLLLLPTIAYTNDKVYNIRYNNINVGTLSIINETIYINEQEILDDEWSITLSDKMLILTGGNCEEACGQLVIHFFGSNRFGLMFFYITVGEITVALPYVLHLHLIG